MSPSQLMSTPFTGAILEEGNSKSRRNFEESSWAYVCWKGKRLRKKVKFKWSEVNCNSWLPPRPEASDTPPIGESRYSDPHSARATATEAELAQLDIYLLFESSLGHLLSPVNAARTTTSFAGCISNQSEKGRQNKARWSRDGISGEGRSVCVSRQRGIVDI